MSQFEFVMTAVSVFMSFGVVRLLDGLRSTFNSNRSYWIHSSWVVIRLCSYVLLWCGSWSVREYESWNPFQFCLWLVPFGLLYLQSTALVTTRPDDIQDWRSHFLRNSILVLRHQYFVHIDSVFQHERLWKYFNPSPGEHPLSRDSHHLHRRLLLRFP